MSIAAVVSQLEVALGESRGPVQQLSQAIAKISNGLEGEVDVPLMQAEVGRCLEALQFYDRMSQHLTHLLDFMSDMTATMDAGMRGEDDEAAWGLLQARLRRRLISDQQRALLDLLLPPQAGVAGFRRAELHADQGSIELF